MDVLVASAVKGWVAVSAEGRERAQPAASVRTLRQRLQNRCFYGHFLARRRPKVLEAMSGTPTSFTVGTNGCPSGRSSP